MDFARNLCHNPRHHQLAAGPCPAHNIVLDADCCFVAAHTSRSARRCALEKLKGILSMSSMEKSGFLSEQISQWIEKHRGENRQWFKLCANINEFSHSTMFNMTIHNKHLPEIIVASLYARAMSNFQGIILMAERGMINEAKALLRCLLECMFAIVAIDKDKKIVNQFVLDDLLQRMDYLKAYKRNRGKGIPHHEGAPSMEEIDNLLKDIKNQIERNHVKKFTRRDLAEKAGMVTTYDSAYKLLSGTIHVNARDLEQYLDINEAGEIKRILWGPDVQEIDFILFTAAESMMSVLVAISRIFSITYAESWKSILDTYNDLDRAFNEEL